MFKLAVCCFYSAVFVAFLLLNTPAQADNAATAAPTASTERLGQDRTEKTVPDASIAKPQEAKPVSVIITAEEFLDTPALKESEMIDLGEGIVLPVSFVPLPNLPPPAGLGLHHAP